MKINFKIDYDNKGFVFLISLFFAVCFWGFVLNDSSTTRIAEIKDVVISYEGESDLKDRNLIITKLSKDTVDVRIEGVSSIVSYATNEDVISKVDLTNITAPGEYHLQVESTFTGNGAVKKSSPETVTVTVERYLEKKVPVEVVLNGDVPNEYYITNIKTDSEYVTVSGGADTVQSISKAKVEVDVNTIIGSYKDTKHSDYKASMNMIYENELGEIVKLDDDNSGIVTLSIYDKKTVPISADIIGEVKSGYRISEIKKSVDSIAIYGLKENLETVTSVMTQSINVRNASGNVKKEVALKKINGVNFVYDGNVSVEVIIVGE